MRQCWEIVPLQVAQVLDMLKVLSIQDITGTRFVLRHCVLTFANVLAVKWLDVIFQCIVVSSYNTVTILK